MASRKSFLKTMVLDDLLPFRPTAFQPKEMAWKMHGRMGDSIKL